MKTDILNHAILDTTADHNRKSVISSKRRKAMLQILGGYPSTLIPELFYWLNKSPRCDLLLTYLLDSGRVGKELHQWIERDFSGNVHSASKHLICLNTGRLLG